MPPRVLLAVLTLSAGGATLAQDCTVSVAAPPDAQRVVPLDIDCPAAPLFKLSESSDFGQSDESGVIVRIDGIDPAGEFVDLSVSYPNGTAGGAGEPFAVADGGRELRVLAVLFDFADDALARPAYATPTWVHKLLFDGDHDGRGLGNTIEAHIEQNTYGTVSLSGEVYPEWVEISPIETYRDLDQGPTSENRFAAEIMQGLIERDPGFFSGKTFDFLIALSPGALAATTVQPYSLYPNWNDPSGTVKGWAMYDLPVDGTSPVFGPIADERRVASSATVVVPRYNPQSVEGVWLASDTERSGVNYFSGGRVRYDIANANYFAQFIELGTPLPDPGAAVSISYTPRAYRHLDATQMSVAPPDTMPDTAWFGLVVHELYHGLGWLLNPLGKHVHDLYQSPMESIGNYGVMAQGMWNRYTVDEVSYTVPGNLSAYSKANLGIVRPLTLRHGESASGLRLYRADESDFAGTAGRIKVIKVPLHGAGERGHRQLVDPYGNERRFAGEEYLLLEWRRRDALAAGAFNFDAALPHSGLVIYRVIDGGAGQHGDDFANLVGVVDATPVTLPVASLNALGAERTLSLASSAAPLGDASGVYEHVAGAEWSWKAADRTTAEFGLSQGAGEKIVHARFMDLDGRIVGETTVAVGADVTRNEPPLADAGDDRVIVDDGDGWESVALDGRGSSDVDGEIVSYVWYEAAAAIAEGATVSVALAPGRHALTLTVVDDDGASASDEVVIDVLDGAVAPPTELSAAVTANEVSLTWTDNAGNEVGFEIERGVRTKGKSVAYATLATVGPNTTGHRFTTEPGTYYYRVRAIEPGGGTTDGTNIVRVGTRSGGKKGPS